MWPSIQVEYLPLASLRPYANNARVHSKRQIKQIARSIEKYGWTNPVLIDDDNQIIAGHGRVEAAKQLGLDKVPTIRLSHLSAADRRAYVIADNRLAEKASWDKEILFNELQGLIDVGVDPSLIGFEAHEIDVLVEDVAAAKMAVEREDTTPSYAEECVTELGDMWQLGKHFLCCGDARDPGAYAFLMNGSKAEFVFTDPPYNVPIDGHVSGLGRVRHQNFVMGCGEMTREQFTAFLADVFRLLAANSAPASIHQICMDWRHMREMLDAGEQVYSELKNVCVWNKDNAGMGSFYRSKHELVFVWKNGDGKHINNFELGQHGRSRSNVWDYAGVNTIRSGRLEELAMHPTVKPVALVADAIRDCSRSGKLVLDPFAGSGTVLIAAERTGRAARALELDPRYVDVAVKRWQSFTGKLAYLCPTGETFEEAAEMRANTSEAA